MARINTLRLIRAIREIRGQLLRLEQRPGLFTTCVDRRLSLQTPLDMRCLRFCTVNPEIVQ